MRAGDVLQAGVVFVGERLAFTIPAFAVVNVVLAAGWIAIVAALNPEYRRQVATFREGPDAARRPSVIPAPGARGVVG